MPWTQQQVADFFGVSERTVQRWDGAGILPGAVPLPPANGEQPIVRYDEAQVRAWWAARIEAAKAGQPATPALVRLPRAESSRRPARRSAMIDLRRHG